MRKKWVWIVAALVAGLLLVMSDAERQARHTSAAPTANPLLAPSTLPFGAPAFDRIRDADFAPAFDAAIADHLAEVAAIANNPAPPTFANTLEALERSGRMLDRVNNIFNCLNGANTDDALQKLSEEYAPKLAAHDDAIALNPKLFHRLATLYDERARLGLDPESLRLLEVQYQEFTMAGARLSDTDKARLKKLNEEDASLSARFTNQLLAASNQAALVTGNAGALAGLSADELTAAAQAARARSLPGHWLLALQNTTQQPALSELTQRATREELFHDSWNRAERGDANDTRATILRLAAIRAEKAQLLGQPNFAAWRLQDQMAKTPQAVETFLDGLTGPATAKARGEAAELQQRIDAAHGGFTLQPWDWDYYSEQVRKSRFDLNDAALRPYFELNRVLQDGVFYAAHQLYGITFQERHDLPVWNPTVRVFEVFDSNGASLGLFYCDYFKRDNKNGGAWMDVLVGQSSLLGTKPVVYNVANFDPPAPGQPALLTFDNVTTMFHEFGHGLHALFAHERYPSLAGTNVARDFVEFPSQFNEHWALNPAVLAHYAVDYKTGAPMPPSLALKLKQSATFNQGYELTELLAAAQLDMQWHTLSAGAIPANADAFETAALQRTHLDLPQVPPRYRSSYFLHIWANGYAAGYYAYLWSEMLDDDAYAWFTEHGGLTRANGQHFRDTILSRGNTEDYAQMYRNFAGRDPQIGPLLKQRGLE